MHRKYRTSSNQHNCNYEIHNTCLTNNTVGGSNSCVAAHYELAPCNRGRKHDISAQSRGGGGGGGGGGGRIGVLLMCLTHFPVTCVVKIAHPVQPNSTQHHIAFTSCLQRSSSNAHSTKLYELSPESHLCITGHVRQKATVAGGKRSGPIAK